MKRLQGQRLAAPVLVVLAASLLHPAPALLLPTQKPGLAFHATGSRPRRQRGVSPIAIMVWLLLRSVFGVVASVKLHPPDWLVQGTAHRTPHSRRTTRTMRPPVIRLASCAGPSR